MCIDRKIREYVDLLLKWNEKINLIGKSTIEDIYNRHILDSKQLLKFFTEKELESSVFADFGTGAGIPGIILSIYGVKNIYLVEKSFRKSQFLNEAKKISDNKITVINKNIFDIKDIKFDIIVSRALAPLNELLKMVKPFCKKNTKCVFLKGKKILEEIEKAKKEFNFNYKLFDSETSSEGKVIIVEKYVFMA